MRILIAPNSMKGSITATEFANVVEKAFLEVSGEFSIRKVPVADGGDFTGEVLRQALGAEQVFHEVLDPLGRKINAQFAVSKKTAIIEMADASGIKLLQDHELNPLKTSTYGTGQLIARAIELGCTEILLGIGGSATVDGGTGMMEALGFTLLDGNNSPVPGNGENTGVVRKILKKSYPDNLSLKIICDVDNPLLGSKGAASVFAPQKGATPQMVQTLEKGLKNWVQVLESETDKELANLKGAGAAGGIALPLLAFFNAEIVRGADFILKKLHFERDTEWADLVITGEGKIDHQTLSDKAPKSVADWARKAGKPVIAIGGAVENDASGSFDGIFSFLPGPLSLTESMKNSKKLLFDFSRELAKFIHKLKNQKFREQ